MKLTPAQQQVLLKILQEKWTDRKCSTCGNSNWSVADIIFELGEYHEGTIILGSGSVAPVVYASCNTCGHMVFFNAMAIGLVDSKTGKVVNG